MRSIDICFPSHVLDLVPQYTSLFPSIFNSLVPLLFQAVVVGYKKKSMGTCSQACVTTFVIDEQLVNVGKREKRGRVRGPRRW